MPYRDRRISGVTFELEIVEPGVRAWALRVATGLGAVILPSAMMGLVSPVLAAGVVAGGAVLGAIFRRAEPYLVPSIWITVDESARAIRVERVEPGATARPIASVPIDAEMQFVVTGNRYAGKLVEVVELRRGQEMLVEVARLPDDIFYSVAFARVERDIAHLNAMIRACAARACPHA